MTENNKDMFPARTLPGLTFEFKTVSAWYILFSILIPPKWSRSSGYVPQHMECILQDKDMNMGSDLNQTETVGFFLKYKTLLFCNCLIASYVWHHTVASSNTL